jgi:predicted RNase H-like HicB family nuclease
MLLFVTTQRKGTNVTGSLTYSVILEPLREGVFIAHVPAFPEVNAEGETEEEAMAQAKEGIERAVAYMQKRGMPVLPEFAEPVIRKVAVKAGG